MKSKVSLIVVVIFAVLATIIVVNKYSKNAQKNSQSITKNVKLPKLIDLGSHSCIPCKMMMPVLDTLREVHAGKLEVKFIDVWKDRKAGDKYGIRVIPTQILYDSNGKELFRHEGFWSCKNIENKMKESGINLGE